MIPASSMGILPCPYLSISVNTEELRNFEPNINTYFNNFNILKKFKGYLKKSSLCIIVISFGKIILLSLEQLKCTRSLFSL